MVPPLELGLHLLHADLQGIACFNRARESCPTVSFLMFVFAGAKLASADFVHLSAILQLDWYLHLVLLHCDRMTNKDSLVLLLLL